MVWLQWLHALENNLSMSWALRHMVLEMLTCSWITWQCQWVRLASSQWLGEKIIWVNNFEPIYDRDFLTKLLPGFICPPWSVKLRFQSVPYHCSIWRVVHVWTTMLLWSPPRLLNSPLDIVGDWDWLKKDWELPGHAEVRAWGRVLVKPQVLLTLGAPCHWP